MADTPTTGQKINGHVFDHSSIEITFAGTIIRATQEISYSGTLEPGKLRGTSPAVLGRTRGEGDHEGSFKLAKADFQALVDALGDNFMEVDFQIICIYAEDPDPQITDTLNGCRITSWSNASSQGTDPTMVECDMHMLEVLLNDKPSFRV